MKDKVKFGEIVFVKDLNRCGQVVSLEGLFDDEDPICLLRMVEVDPKTGGRFVTLTRRPLDMISDLPEGCREEAAVQLYQSPIEKVYQFAELRKERNRKYYDNVGDPVTVENHAQRRAGYYEALAEVQFFIDNLMRDLRDTGCAANWYAARDDDGMLTLFDAKPAKNEVVKGHLWYSKTGVHRVSIPKEYLPNLATGCAPVRITVELIMDNGYGSEDAQ